MRIRYHFLADLPVTRHMRETEYEKRFRHTLNKPCRVELLTSRNRDYRPREISEHSFFIYYSEITDGIFQGKPNIDENFRIGRDEKWHELWIIVDGLRSWKLDFPNICNLFLQFSNYIYRLFTRQCCWFISVFILVNEVDHVHVPVDTVFNQTGSTS